MNFVKKYGGLIFLFLCIALAAAAVKAAGAGRQVFAPAEAEGIVYVIDAGHGGEDGGALTPGGDKESDVNLAVARRLEELLFLLGRETAMTRREDVSIYSEGAETLRQKKVSDLKNRVALVNGTPGAVLVSVHQNSMPAAPSVRGAQVFYGRAGEALARSVQQVLNERVNAGKPKEAKAIDPSIYLMKHAVGPAILVECGFLSNAEEAARLWDPTYQTALAAYIAAGLLKAEGEER